jgi:hypothetical protein
MTLYKNKYRIESIRLPNRDYAANGLYFVTICTRDRINSYRIAQIAHTSLMMNKPTRYGNRDRTSNLLLK